MISNNNPSCFKFLVTDWSQLELKNAISPKFTDDCPSSIEITGILVLHLYYA